MRFQGQIHPFAPFDPARELAYRNGLPGPDDAEDGPPEKYSSLDLVKDAIRNKGFIGVKVYNTIGYRPLGNGAVDEERRRIFRHNGMRQYEPFTGQQFDDVLSELYDFCVQEQVPITAHCVSNGIEAYWRASFDFGRPQFWRAVLDAFPDLHVNLAHSFGGPTHTEMSVSTYPEGEKTWTREICEMMTEYQHLYADVAHHGVTVDRDIPKYKKAYRGMCADFPGLIQRKTLFGIDWHVITRAENHEQFKDRYVDVLGDEDIFTAEEIEDFLGGNALHFLGLLPLGTDPVDGWTKNRERLHRFYRDNHIDPPNWFVATG